MERTSKTASQILTEAADLLEQEDNWGQGSYFKFEQKTEQSNSPACVMCAHGAIAYCGRAEVKSLIDNGDAPTQHQGPAVPSVHISDEMHAIAEEQASLSLYSDYPLIEHRAQILVDTLPVNPSLPKYIREHYKGETGLAHHRANEAGLTIAFNDTPGRTKQEVIAKLREAAQPILVSD